MSLLTKIVEAVHSWGRRRDATKSRKRADLAMEHLDHRQLMAVNFTGNVPIDFPATESPGVVTLPGNPNISGYQNFTPQFPTTTAGQQLQSIIKVSGFQINDLRVSYDTASDTLSVGLDGPDNQKTGQEVIAGDSDNNGNSATVDPRISDGTATGTTGISPGFQDPPDLGQSKSLGIFLDLKNPTVGIPATPDVVAGFPTAFAASTAPKSYEVALPLAADPSTAGSPHAPIFDPNNILPQYTGNYYLANDPNHPNFELQIVHFSQLYQQITGTTLTPTSQIGVGGFSFSQQDDGISDEYFPAQPLTLAQATTPVINPVNPVNPVPLPTPASPTIYVNPHQNYHVNSAHPTAVRVTVLGSSGFNPLTIVPSSVRFGSPSDIADGATPILAFENNVNHDQFPDETFVFDGLDVKLPSGVSVAEIAGFTTSGQPFISDVRVFNRDASYYSQAALNQQQARFAKYDAAHGIDTTNGVVPPPVKIPTLAQQRANTGVVNDLLTPFKTKAPAQVNTTGTTRDHDRGRLHRLDHGLDPHQEGCQGVQGRQGPEDPGHGGRLRSAHHAPGPDHQPRRERGLLNLGSVGGVGSIGGASGDDPGSSGSFRTRSGAPFRHQARVRMTRWTNPRPKPDAWRSPRPWRSPWPSSGSSTPARADPGARMSTRSTPRPCSAGNRAKAPASRRRSWPACSAWLAPA